MSPSDFNLTDHLSDWSGCFLKVRCSCSFYATLMPVRLLLQEHGNCSFGQVVAALRCSDCEGMPAPVHLVAGHTRSRSDGRPQDWVIEVVPLLDAASYAARSAGAGIPAVRAATAAANACTRSWQPHAAASKPGRSQMMT
jgi:hypothetical protein